MKPFVQSISYIPSALNGYPPRTLNGQTMGFSHPKNSYKLSYSSEYHRSMSPTQQNYTCMSLVTEEVVIIIISRSPFVYKEILILLLFLVLLTTVLLCEYTILSEYEKWDISFTNAELLYM